MKYLLLVALSLIPSAALVAQEEAKAEVTAVAKEQRTAHTTRKIKSHMRQERFLARRTVALRTLCMRHKRRPGNLNAGGFRDFRRKRDVFNTFPYEGAKFGVPSAAAFIFGQDVFSVCGEFWHAEFTADCHRNRRQPDAAFSRQIPPDFVLGNIVSHDANGRERKRRVIRWDEVVECAE